MALIKSIFRNIFRCLLLLILIGGIKGSSLWGQVERFNKSFDLPQGSNGVARSVMKKDDGGYILVSSSRTNGLWGRKVVLYELAENGDTLQSSVIGGGPWEDYTAGFWSDCIVEAQDSGFFVPGAYRDTSDFMTAQLYKFGPDLDTNWVKRYQDQDTLKELFIGIERLPSGGLVLCGKKEHPSKGARAWFLKTDSQGNVIWEQKVGANHDGPFQANSIEKTSDGGFISAGFLKPWYPSGNEVGTGVLFKLDSSGQLEWKRSFKGSYGYGGVPVLETQDRNYVIGGVKHIAASVLDDRSVGFIRKYDTSGQLLWESVYAPDTSDPFYGAQQSLYDLSETENGHLVGAGWRFLQPFTPEQADSTKDGWVMKAAPDGQLLWQRYHRHAPEGDFRFWEVNTTDRGIIAAGYCNVADSTNYERMNAWVIGLDSMGCLRSGCAVGTKEFHEKGTGGITLYPNPAKERLYVQLPKRRGKGGTLRIWNVNGVLMEERKEMKEQGAVRIDVSSYPRAVYVIRWRGGKGRVLSERFIVH